MTTIIWGAPNWLWPSLLIIAVLIVVLAWSYSKGPAQRGVRILAASLKVLAVLAISICLLEPLVSGTRPRPKANVFAVLIDNSESMTIEDRGLPEPVEVRDWLRPEAPAWKARLEQDFDLRIYSFDRNLRRADSADDLQFQGKSSQLAEAIKTLDERFQNRPIAGALLISDGNATDLMDTTDPQFPIYPVFSDGEGSADLRLEQVRINQTNFETSPTTIEATLVLEGKSQITAVAELCDPAGEVVESQSVELVGKEPTSNVRFRFRPAQTGLSFYRLNVFPKGEREEFYRGETRTEATLANNTRALMITRGGGPYRILYVGGRPNWEFKFLRRALDEDDEIQLVGMLRIANKEPKFAFRDQKGVGDTNRLFEGFDNKDSEDAESYKQPVLVRFGIEDESELRDGFPKSPEELFAYHAIILDDIEADFFSADQLLLLRSYVNQRGGGLLMLGGPGSFQLGNYEKTPIEELLPVYLDAKDRMIDDDVTFELTREGWLEPWIRLRSTESEEEARLAEMPRFHTLNPTGDAKPGASVIADARSPSGQQAPAIATQRFGKGRTAAAMIGDLWRWSMRRSEVDENDLSVFWRQTMRWLTADVPQRVEVDVADSANQEMIEIRTTVHDADYKPFDSATVSLKIVTPEEKEFTLEAEPDPANPGVYLANYWPEESGGYELETKAIAPDGSLIDRRTTGWTSEPSVHEFARIAPNRAQLEQLAESSGGERISPSELDSFVSSLSRRKVPVTEPWVYPLWHQPFVIVFAVCCLCAEWGLRRWKGLA